MTRENRTLFKIGTGIAAIALLFTLRGVFPEIYRYFRIRRM